MGHIADMVPNHVGIATNDNVWWNDVLENGPASIYAKYFDINWEGSPQTDLNGRVLIATLGKPYGEELEQGHLHLLLENGAFFIGYHDRRFPISPRSYPAILGTGNDSLKPGLTTDGGLAHGDARILSSPPPQPSPGVPGEGEGLRCSQDMVLPLRTSEPAAAELRWIIDACTQLPDRCEGRATAGERHQAKEQIKARLAKLLRSEEAMRNLVAQNVEKLNGVPAAPRSFDQLDNLLRQQCFRLAYWKTAPDEINYRRFFDINDLAALSMERPEVFTATHGFILNLLAKRDIAGLRIDHPDGLYDPKTYFQRLQTYYVLAVAREMAAASPPLREARWDELETLLLERLERWVSTQAWDSSGPPLYVLAEKILAVDEPIPKPWPIHGTSGYEFLNMTNGLFVDSASAGAFDQLYRDWTGSDSSFDDLVYSSKKLILDISLASELNMLAGELKRIAERDRHGIDYSLHGLHTALKEVIACFSVYRSYIDHDGPSAADINYIDQAIAGAVRRNPGTEPSIFKFIRDTLLDEGKLPTPSPGTPGEGGGEGVFEHRKSPDIPNHPHPLPEYRERGQEDPSPTSFPSPSPGTPGEGWGGGRRKSEPAPTSILPRSTRRGGRNSCHGFRPPSPRAGISPANSSNSPPP